MRRPKRQMKDPAEIRKFLEECKVCRVGMQSQGGIYVVPMNFGYEYEEGTLSVYLHSAKVGRKIEALRENPQVCVEMDGRHALAEAQEPCSHSYLYASLIGTGKARIAQTPREREYALRKIMEHQTGKDCWEFDEKWVNAVEVVCIELEEFTCKHHNGMN